ncbi:vitamin-B12 independent methionine synthase [Kyrpidia tusciae]|uniref:Methionine synthase vitamin-B12 independent n=1 Tax=Kyrpidia tusciae (strain DSM 2912 / NBRC 15312 / T2) TaxID=562970 RepID=D5WUA6_KYRT2|nr:vitamin-B12 independent methionine synthase [Kyrpidia tusciae]ADG07358.1 Methionine synthase vitamin-B12 independent [Kyrpidia tusciae DSM 2912]
MKIRGEEILFPTTIVGSYVRPFWLTGKIFSEGADAPEFESFRAREMYHDAVALAVKDMEDAGLDIVTDGGQYYENETNYEYAGLFHYMAERLEGYAPYGDRIKLHEFDLPIYKPTVLGPVRWKRPVFKPVLEAVQRATRKPIKINCSLGPATLAALSTDRHYGGDVAALAMDVAAAYNQEFKDLEQRGVDMIQVTEPLPLHQLGPWIRDAINRAFEGISAYKVVHVCYGHEEGQPGILERRLHEILPLTHDLNVNMLHFEMSTHDFDEVERFKDFPADKDLGVGVISPKSLVVERPQQIADWILRTTRYVRPEQLCISTDCGMASFRRVVAFKKLKAMVEGTQLARAELTGVPV